MHLSDKPPSLRQALVSPLVGLLLGAIAIPTVIAPLAVLVFGGPLASHAAMGVGIALFSAAVVSLVLAWRSSFANTLAMPIPEEMVVMAAIAASVTEAMPPGVSNRELILSVMVAIALTSILTGGILWFLGQMRFGESIRFLPYPAIGGVFAGLGFLLVKGACQFLLGTPIDPSNLAVLGTLLQLPTLWHWLPSCLLAIALLWFSRHHARILVLFLGALGSTALFYLILLIGHCSIAQASAEGWLLGPFPTDEMLWQPLNFRMLGAVHWNCVLPQIPQMLSVGVVSTLSMLLVSSGIELATERDLDLNRELRAMGLANMLSGLGGGLVGSPSALSVQAYQWGANNRLVGVAAAVLYLGVLCFGLQGVAFFPKPALGGLLLYMGFELLWRWLHDTLLRLPLRDYGLVFAIAIAIATLGFVPGMVIGLTVAIVLFVVDYSQMRIARAALTGATYSSRVQRPVNQERLLRDRGETIYILQLQGPIFFGTLYKLLGQIRARLDDPACNSLQYVILDCQWVSGIDASAITGFAKLQQALRKHEIACLIAHLSADLEERLRQSRVLVDGNNDGDSDYACFPDLDRAVEWCENQIVAASRWRRARTLPVVLQIKFLFGSHGDVAPTFAQYLEKISLPAQMKLFERGESPEALYFVENGQISTIAPLLSEARRMIGSDARDLVVETYSNGQTRRVQTLRAGTFLGELEFFTRVPYRLSAIADRASTLYRLDRPTLERMQRDDPAAALAFSDFINTLLAERLAQAQQEIDRFFA
ncbi:MAG: SulP family inorganic anion transporter [Cyanobacteria bacterium J06641_5]